MEGKKDMILHSQNYWLFTPLLGAVKMSPAVNEKAVNENEATSVVASLKLFTLDSFSRQSCK